MGVASTKIIFMGPEKHWTFTKLMLEGHHLKKGLLLETETGEKLNLK